MRVNFADWSQQKLGMLPSNTDRFQFRIARKYPLSIRATHIFYANDKIALIRGFLYSLFSLSTGLLSSA